MSPQLVLLVVGSVVTLGAWGYQVGAAIDFAKLALSGVSRAWWFVGTSSLGAIVCLALMLVLAGRALRTLGLISDYRPRRAGPRAAGRGRGTDSTEVPATDEAAQEHTVPLPLVPPVYPGTPARPDQNGNGTGSAAPTPGLPARAAVPAPAASNGAAVPPRKPGARRADGPRRARPSGSPPGGRRASHHRG